MKNIFLSEKDYNNSSIENIENKLKIMRKQMIPMTIFTDFCITLMNITSIESAVTNIITKMTKIVNCNSVVFIRKEVEENYYAYYLIKNGNITKQVLHRRELGKKNFFIFCKNLKIANGDENFLALPIKYEGENLAAIKFEKVDLGNLTESDKKLLNLMAIPSGVVIKNSLLVMENSQEKKIISLNNKKIKQNLEYAQKIQRNIILSGYKEFGRYSFYGEHKEAEYLGGDFYDVVKTKNNNIVFYLADVSGHGAASALITVFFKQKINDIINRYGCMELNIVPSKLLYDLQEEFSRVNLNEKIYIGIIIGVVNLMDNTVTLSSAGHNVEPIKITKNQAITISIEGLPINNWSFDKELYIYEDKKFHMNKEESIILLSDGAVEIQTDKEMLSIETIKEFLWNNRKKNMDEQFNLLLKFINSSSIYSKLQDDVAFLTIKRTQ